MNSFEDYTMRCRATDTARGSAVQRVQRWIDADMLPQINRSEDLIGFAESQSVTGITLWAISRFYMEWDRRYGSKH